MKRIAIIGSRTFNSLEDLRSIYKNVLKKIWRNAAFEIVSGGCPTGVDALAKQLAEEEDQGYKEFPADWDTHGKAAGPIRNRQIAEYSQAMVAIWNGSSKGTKNAIDEMIRLGKPVFIFPFNEMNIYFKK